MRDTSANIYIVKSDRSHVPEILQIERESFQVPWPAEAFLEELEFPGAYMYVARHGADDNSGNGEVAGYILFWIFYEKMQIINIAVARKWRRKGIGQKLLNKALTIARRKKIRKLSLEVRRSNFTAIKFYEKHGFQVTGCYVGYYTNNREDALIMEQAPADFLNPGIN